MKCTTLSLNVYNVLKSLRLRYKLHLAKVIRILYFHHYIIAFLLIAVYFSIMCFSPNYKTQKAVAKQKNIEAS